jgi:hypothetical protein
MSYNSNGVFTAGTCLDNLIQLESIQGGDFSAAKKRSKIGYLEAITSPLNKMGMAQIPVQEGSKERLVQVRWGQRAITSQVNTTDDGTCDTDDFPDFNSTTFSVTKYVDTKFAMDMKQFKKVCMGRSEFFDDVIMRRFDALAKTINGELLTEQLTNFGVNHATGSSATKSVTVFPAATGAPNASALQELMSDFEVENEFVGTPIIIGAGNIYKFWKTLEVGCCNDAGINMLDLSNSLGWAPFVDKQVDTIIGANQFIMMEQHAVQFVPFNDYVGEDATSAGDSVARGTITDPKTGVTYDIKVLQDDCSDKWNVIISLHYDIFFTPLDQYQVDDPLRGSNGTLRYTAATS